MNRRILAVLIAVLLAIGGGALVVLYAKNADARAIENQQPEKVWVAQKLVPAGTSLKDAQRTELIAQTSVAAAALPAGALQEITPENNSLLALSDVQPGEFLMTARFGTTPVGTKAIQVPSGLNRGADWRTPRVVKGRDLVRPAARRDSASDVNKALSERDHSFHWR